MHESIPPHVAEELVFHFDIHEDPGVLADPHAGYARLHREAPPIFWTPANGGHWVITRYELMTAIAQDWEHFSTRMLHIPAVKSAPVLLPLNVDPPEHTAYRQMLAPYFSPKSVARMEADIRQLARDVIGTVAGRGGCDFVRDVAAPFPVTVFMRMMGLPPERFDRFRTIVEAFFRAHGMEAVAAAAQPIFVELAEILEERKASHKAGSRHDLIANLLDARIDGRPVDDDKLLRMAFLLVLAGLDTVTNALSFSIHHLAQRVEVQQRLQEEPELVGAFTEESIRLYGVVNTPRITVKDCDRFGARFRCGDMLLLTLPIAGWDETKNERPEVFDLDRKHRSGLLFSTGPHLCLGHFLARTEMKIFYSEWLRAIGRFDLQAGFKPSYRGGTVMSLQSLPLKWSPSA